MSVTYPKQGLQSGVAFQQNGKPGTYPVQSWNDEIGTFQFPSTAEEGTLIPFGAAVVQGIGDDGVRLPQSSDAIAAGQSAGASVAQGTLTFNGNPVADDTVTIGTVAYKFVDAVAAANDVLIGESATATAMNLVAAIEGQAGAGSLYGAGTVANASAHALLSENGVVTVFADNAGAEGNAIALKTTSAVVVVSGATLTGGIAAGEAAAANARFVGVAVFSYYTTMQAGGYRKSELDVNVPVKQKGYVTVLMTSLEGAAFGVDVAIDFTALGGKFKVAGEGDTVVGKINKVFPAYGTCEITLKEFI